MKHYLRGPEHPSWKGGKTVYACSGCGKSVKRYRSQAPCKNVYCGRPCSLAALAVLRKKAADERRKTQVVRPWVHPDKLRNIVTRDGRDPKEVLREAILSGFAMQAMARSPR